MKPMGMGQDGQAGPPREPLQAAAYWSARRRLGLMNARDEAAFETWHQVPDHAVAYAAAEAAVDDLGAVAADVEVRLMREAALAVHPPPRRRSWLPLAAAAAMAVLAIGVWIDRSPTPVPLSPPSEVKRYATAVGERLDVKLDDGSSVALNTASVLTVAYSSNRRDVRLLRGQALFQVAKDPLRPFVVTAGDRRITATGTAFDVRVDDGRMKVVLVEGRVQIEPIRLAGLARLIPSLERDALEPGEQLTAGTDHRSAVSAADVERDTSWQDGRLIFRNDTLANAVAEINRYSETQLVVEDPRAADLRISGVFGTARPENFVAALGASYPIEARQRSPQVIGLVWRERELPSRQ